MRDLRYNADRLKIQCAQEIKMLCYMMYVTMMNSGKYVHDNRVQCECERLNERKEKDREKYGQ